MSEESLLKEKKAIQKKQPAVRRIEKHRHPQLPDNWRKPKGHHSKIRRGMKWELRMPKVGFKTPSKLLNTDKLGREFIKINDEKDLKKLSDKTVGIVKAGLGLKKKSLIAKAAMGKNYIFQNFNPEKIMKKVESLLKKEKKQPKIVAEKTEEKVQKPTKKPQKPSKEQGE